MTSGIVTAAAACAPSRSSRGEHRLFSFPKGNPLRLRTLLVAWHVFVRSRWCDCCRRSRPDAPVILGRECRLRQLFDPRAAAGRGLDAKLAAVHGKSNVSAPR